MNGRMLFALAAMTAATACDQSPATEPRQRIVVRSEAQDQLHQLDDLNRAIALKRAIHATGLRCKRVTESGYVQEHDNLSMWTATCEDGRKWAIFAGPDGTAQVRACTDVERFGLPACVIRKNTPPPGSAAAN